MEQVNTKKKVLIVDDEPNVRRLSRTILSKKFEVVEAEDGRQAVEIAGKQQPDVILMDMMMPNMDGLTSCYAIRNDPATKSIPVIMVTAIGFELNIKLSQQMGANAYVTKPFAPKDLFDKIQQVFAIPSNSGVMTNLT
jgi:two-component system, OmpR family, alkaline phosphatase synthesis response regulator PhoP